MKSSAPKISVLMVVYNGANFLGASIQSILGQTFHDFELLIVNDGSTDGTRQILERQTDSRIRIFHTSHQGRPKARNACLSHAGGKFLAIQDADDISHPNRLQIELDYLEAHPEVEVLGASYDVINAEGKILAKSVMQANTKVLRRKLYRDNPFLHSSLMFRRSLIERIGTYDESFTIGQDYEWLTRAAQQGGMAVLANILAQKRIHPKTIYMNIPKENLRHHLRVRKLVIERFSLPFYYHLLLLKPYLVMKMPSFLVRNLLALKWLLKGKKLYA